MSIDTQNGSHLTVIDTPEKLRAELDRIEGLIRTEQKRIAEQPPIGTTLVDPDEDDEPQPETDELPHRWRVYAISWLVILLASTTLAVGYRVAIEVQPSLDLFHVTQVGSVENG